MAALQLHLRQRWKRHVADYGWPIPEIVTLLTPSPSPKWFIDPTIGRLLIGTSAVVSWVIERAAGGDRFATTAVDL